MDDLRSLWALVVLLLLPYRTSASVATNWTNPNARLPSFSSTFLVGERIYLSWLALNDSSNDLWLTRYATITDDFALRIASDLYIGTDGSFAWTIALSNEEVLQDTRFEFQFVPAGANYDPQATTDLASPAFNLMLVNQNTLPNGTAGAMTGEISPTATSTSFSSATAAQTSSSSLSSSTHSSSGNNATISSAAAGGITAGVLAVVGLAGFAGGYWVFKKRQARHNKTIRTAGDTGSDITMTGPYEILGDRRQPIELNDKEARVHELNVSQETMVTESDSSPVFEVNGGGMKRRDGLHEMPG